MKHRESILQQLNKIESLTNELNFIVNQQLPIQEYKSVLSKIQDCIEQTRAYVESEPISGYELNVAAR
jgi:hypothetical protein